MRLMKAVIMISLITAVVSPGCADLESGGACMYSDCGFDVGWYSRGADPDRSRPDQLLVVWRTNPKRGVPMEFGDGGIRCKVGSVVHQTRPGDILIVDEQSRAPTVRLTADAEIRARFVAVCDERIDVRPALEMLQDHTGDDRLAEYIGTAHRDAARRRPSTREPPPSP